MNAQTLYRLPTRLFRTGRSDAEITAAITRVATKPTSNGMTTDLEGNHYLTNLSDSAIDVIAPNGQISRLIQDNRLSFPDSVRFGADGWLYILATQLHKAPIFTGQPEAAAPPYILARVQTGKQGQIGR
jgi:sugar lactone lactonase YvrE